MTTAGPERRRHNGYDRVQRTIHWVTAALFLSTIAIGLYCSYQRPGTSPRRELLEIHKSIGMTIFFLAIFRLIYRLWKRPPSSPQFGRLVKIASSTAHGTLYFLMFAMPVTGYLNSAAGGYSLHYFWTFSWPRLIAHDPAVAHLGETLHGLLAWVVYGVVALHIAATAWHEMVARDGTLGRMWPIRAG